MIIYGKHPCFLCLKAKGAKIYEIYVAQKQNKILREFCHQNQIDDKAFKIKVCDSKLLDNLAGFGNLHQGFVMKISAPKFTDFDDFTNNLSENKPNLVILDSITDVHNIGAIIRSCVAFGVEHVVVARNFPIESAVIFKASAGVAFAVNFIAPGNLNNAVKKLKDCGYWVVGMDGNGDGDVKKINQYQPCVVVLGNEGRGISNLLKKNCDLLVKIDIDKKVESLNVSNACSIALNYLKNG